MVKADARTAIMNARRDADRELARLSRLDALRQGTLQPDSSFEGWRKVVWVLLIMLQWLLIIGIVALTVLYLLSVPPDHLAAKAEAGRSVLLIFSSIIITGCAVWFRGMADDIRFPVLKPAVIMEI